MENFRFIIKYLSEINLSNNINLSSCKMNYSPYQDMFLFLINNNLFYKGFCINQQNSKSVLLEKINSNTNKASIINLQQKFIQCDFTSEYIYLISQNKNEVYVSKYLSPLNNKSEILSILTGILHKKKIKSIACGINTALFLTYGGMVYTNTDKEKDKQKFITNLLEYNIDNIYAGSKHFFCTGQKRNTSEVAPVVFSWGDNLFGQCGLDPKNENIIEPKIILNGIEIKKISLGNNHSIILTKEFGSLIFGNNQFKQCCNINDKILKLVYNDNLLPITDATDYVLPIEYLVKNNESIIDIEAKNNSSMFITDKYSFIFRGKIFDSKEKIFKLSNEKIYKNIIFLFGGDNFFLTIHNINNINQKIFFEVENNDDFISPNSNYNTPLKTKEPNFTKPVTTTAKNTIVPSRNELTFEELKKEQGQALTTTSDLSRDSLSELRNYISLLGISFSTSYNDSNLSFRPNNLKPKSKEEEQLHRQMVLENRKMYLNFLKEKQEMEKSNSEILNKKKKDEKEKEEFWKKEILPNWSKFKNNKNIKKYFYVGIPKNIRGKVWSLCIGNKSFITKEYYGILAKNSIKLLIELGKKNSNKNENNEVGSESSSSIMSLNTKRAYANFIKKTLDKAKSIYLIDLDIERTFPYMGIFKKDSQYGEDLREILRIFVVERPDIGYVQGLSYIAATLLLQMEKFQAFICLTNIVLSPNILPFYMLDEEKIKTRLNIFNDIFQINLPKLYEHFQKNEILPEHYLLEWFMTLYTRNLFIELAYKIWDIYIIEGITALYKSAIAILTIHEKDYLDMEFSDIMNHIKNLENNNYDEDNFIDRMNKTKFSDEIMKNINKINEEYLVFE